VIVKLLFVGLLPGISQTICLSRRRQSWWQSFPTPRHDDLFVENLRFYPPQSRPKHSHGVLLWPRVWHLVCQILSSGCPVMKTALSYGY